MVKVENFDLMMTATLRPELIKKTLDSHINGLFGDHIKKARLIINIDKVGSDTPYKTVNEIINIIDNIPFKGVSINITDNPSFSRAFYWCLKQLSSEYVFNLEEDWRLRREFDFADMVELFDKDPDLVHLRLSAFRCDGSNRLKNWNKFTTWNGSYYEISQDLKGTIGWAGHPSLNRTAFLSYFSLFMNPESNPEKQIKGKHPIILESKFGNYHPKKESGPAVVDIGRKWMVENGYQKKGSKAFFTEWTKIEEEK